VRTFCSYLLPPSSVKQGPPKRHIYIYIKQHGVTSYEAAILAVIVVVKVKVFHYKPDVDLGVPGG
jgi:hypothetical protein